jgi:drug/metabolite transporter (DMT)-like permease
MTAETESSLDLKAVFVLTVLCALWGLNAVAIKVSNAGISPIFTAALRSVIATVCLMLWMRSRGLALFPSKVFDGFIIGLLFGLEFGVLYSALLYTTTSSAWILLYTTPFFHALGAHFLLRGDPLTFNKTAGLAVAFFGILYLLGRHMDIPSHRELLGDLLALGAAVLWAATTIYVKKSLVGTVTPYHTLFYQTVFSIPILFALSAWFEKSPVQEISPLVLISVAYQSIVVAFLSYLLWFSLVHKYSVSRLSAFTFLTPVFAAIAGTLLLKEPLTARTLISLGLISSGIYLVNRTRSFNKLKIPNFLR